MPDPTLLDRALRAARQGVELSPESARGYQMLFTVLFARRDLPAAFAAGDRAIALNPFDMTILSDYGGRLIASGEIDRGMEILNRAAEEGAVRPSWYQFYLFLGSYLKNDTATAARHAALSAIESYPLGLLAKALIAAADGNGKLARESYDQLVALRAAWRDTPREELARLFPAPEIADRLSRDLARAGLAPAR
jgi:Tfp pilus assembly protein PilF